MISSVVFGALLMTLNSELVFSEGALIVETEVGTIRGARATDGNYTIFVGIPYARVNPDNVFGAAMSYPRFKGIYDAVGNVTMCPQIEVFNKTFIGSIDCLNLNIYVPDAVGVSRPLPVMVYVYGGGFEHGFTGNWLYNPKYIVRHDVMVVIFNYRTGPYGFFCLDIPEVLGNQGLKDQILALRWIQKHIRSFGGDPERVTVFANSAGATAIDLHLVSNFEPLFQNAIFQSSTATKPGTIKQDDSSEILHLTALLGHNTNNITDALSFLNYVNPELLVTTFENNKFTFLPCLESSKYPDVPTFLTNYPININKSWKNITILTGVNHDEQLTLFYYFKVDISAMIPTFFSDAILSAFNFNDTIFAELEQIVRNFYIGDNELSLAVKRNLIEFSSDIQFIYQAYRRVQKYLDNDVEKIFFYLFNYEGGRNYGRVYNHITEHGITHADELPYLFAMDYLPEPVTETDQLMIDRMTTLWTNFAKYDNPTPELTPLLPVKWEPITKDSLKHYLTIDTELTFNHSFFHERMSFWSLFYKTYAEYEIGYGFVSSSASLVFISPVFYLVVLLVKLLN